MIPKILEYSDGILNVTENAYMIPELKVFIDKYKEPEPYLAYIHNMTSPTSAYINLEKNEKVDNIVYDIHATFNDFDPTDPDLEKAVDKLNLLYISPHVALADELGQELHRFRMLIKTQDLTIGEGGNFKERMALMEKIEKISSSYLKVREQADKELNTDTKGDHEIGEY